MARVRDIVNEWGKQGGANPQRSDLWQVDLDAVVKGLNEISGLDTRLFTLPRYYSASVSLPEQKMRAEVVRRDSRSYNMPSWDEPLESFRFTFILDDGGKNTTGASAQIDQSSIYTLLDSWRSVVRAGRGPVGSETSIRLGATYRVDYAFPIYILLLKGQALPAVFSNNPAYTQRKIGSGDDSYSVSFNGGAFTEEQITYAQVVTSGGFSSLFSNQVGLEVSGILRLENAWLAGFKVSELSYQQAQVATIDATIYADNILQIRRMSQL